MTNREKERRNKWYRLAFALETEALDVTGYAERTGFQSANGLMSFLKTHGKTLAGKYGRLPFRFCGSKTITKFMEDGDEF